MSIYANSRHRRRGLTLRLAASITAASTFLAPVAPAFAEDVAPLTQAENAPPVAGSPAPQDISSATPSDIQEDPFSLSPTPAADSDAGEASARQSAKTDKTDKPKKGTSEPISLMSGEPPPPPYHDPRHTAHVNIKADEATGALTTVFPIRTPPGRKGVEPSLSLSYSSRNTDNANIAGYGWSVDIPYIERINKRGSNKLFTEYDFRSSLDDELGRKESATSTEDYGAKTETGAFRQYEFVDHAWWRMTDKQGWTYTFGTTTASQIASSTNVFRWMLEKIEDPNGNSVTYEYEKDTGQIYPMRIAYTRSAGDTGLFQVEFTKESRSDIATSSAFGFPVASRYRISEIQVKVNGAWVYKYALGYTTGDAGGRSLLASITETGRDEDTGNTLTLPATQFTYQRSAGAWTYTEHSFDLSNIPGFSYKDTQGITWDLGTRFGDVNGDSLPDIFYGETLYLHTGTSSWTTNHNYSLSGIPYFTNPDSSDNGTRVIDVNGDGMDDIMRLVYTSGVGASHSLYLNKADGTGWTSNHSYDLSNLNAFMEDGIDAGVRIMDVNGDGLPDLLKLFETTSGIVSQLHLNKGDGTGWTTSHNYVLTGLPTFSYRDASGIGHDQGTRVIDANGDGLPDLLKSQGAVHQLYLNKGDGTGWSPDHKYNAGDLPAFVSGDSDNAVRLLDANGDGLEDVIRLVDNSGVPPEHTLYLNKGDGTGWTTSHHYPLDPVGDFMVDGGDTGLRIMDVNADGLPDMLQRYQIGGGNPIRYLYLQKGERGDILSTIRSSAGATTTVLYKESAAYRDTNSKPINTRVPFALDLVSEIAVSDTLSPTGTTTFTYGGGEYYYNGPYDREFALFATTTRTDAQGFITKSFYHQQGSTTQASIGEYQDHIAKKGKPYRIEAYDAANNLYKKTVNSWDRAALDYQRNFVYLARTTDMTYDGDSDHKDTAQTYRYTTTTGNLAYKQDWGEVSGSDDGAFTSSSTAIFGTSYSYAASSTGYLVGLPSRETVVNNASTTVKDTKFYYDSLALDSVSKGNETKREMWRSGSSWIDTEKTYNSYGLATQDKDPRDKITTYTYDSYNLHAATSTNPAGLATGFVYDYSQGKPKRVNDPNSLIFETVYDALDRVVQERQPDLTTPGTLVTKAAYTYTDTLGSRAVQETRYLDGSVSTDRYMYRDGLDRTIQERLEAEDASTYAVKDFIYDNKGRLSRESLPYFSTGSGRTASTSTTALYATTSYDPMDRPTSIVTAAGTTAYAYDDWKTAITDPNGNIKRTLQDAYGNLVRVEEVNGTETYITAYEYDSLKNLTKITDAQSNIRNFTYDALGRRLTAEDLHASGDASYGTWYFAYDDAGNVASTTDPKSQNVVYAYDDINRPLSEDYSGTSGITDITYSYDSCAYGALRLCGATTTAAGINYTYDPAGGIKTERHATSTSIFTTTYTRDRQGNITGITYPDGATVTYAYNSAGLLETVSKLENGTTTAILIVADTDYGPTGAVTYRDFGNGTETVYTYDPNVLYRLTNIRTTEHEPDESFGIGGIGLLALDEPTLFTAIEDAVMSPEGSALPAVTEGAPAPESATAAATTSDVSAVTDAIVPAGENADTDSVPPAEVPADTAAQVPETSPADAALEIPAAATSSESAVLPSVADLAVPEAASSTPPLTEPVPSLEILLADKSATERAAIKGEEIAKLGSISRTPREGYDIEIASMKSTPQGVEVFARAWNVSGEQIGFGRDGSVEIERFIITNPPVLVADAEGTIVRRWIERDTGRPRELHFREDAREALLQVLEHTLSVKQEIHDSANIVPGKIGRSTLVAYPAAGANSPADGETRYGPTSVDWSVMDSATVADSANADHPAEAEVKIGSATQSQKWRFMSRAIFMFDTSSIGEGVVSSSTLSLYGGKNDEGNISPAINVYSVNPQSTSNIVTTDYGTYDSIQLSSTISYGGWSTSAYNNFLFNSTGRAAISGTSTSKFGAREATYDAGTSTPTWSSGFGSGFQVKPADVSGTTQDPKLTVEYSSPNQAPTAPTDMLTEGSANPANIVDTTPEFSAIYNDPDTGDSAVAYRIQVSTSTSWTNLLWDVATTTMATTTQGNRSPDISYAGTDLALDTLYYWRIKFSDATGSEGAWSTSTSTFMLAGSSVHVQDITYTYDSVGNITQISDNSASGAGKVVSFAYDGLNRLTYASTTAASSTPYLHTFSYAALGNITGMSTSSATTTYTYASTGYANPHAATGVGGYTLTYDNNGNLTSYGSNAYTWDYRNRLANTGAGTATSTYGYDYQNNRVSQTAGGITTIYVNKLYSTNNASTTKHIFAGNDLIAVVERTTATTTHIIHTDHLGGTNAITDANGDIVQALDYYPYGASRINNRFGSFNEKRKFIGIERDEETGLDYALNRYYANERGQFISQDLVFWEIGQTRDGSAVLWNPQAQNSYNYGQNNPLVNKDPDGRIAVGIGLNGGGNIPGLYGGGSTYMVLIISGRPFNVGVGIISSAQGGGTTAILGAEGTAGFLFSNARNIRELEGPEVIAGGSLSAGLDFGIDVGISRANNSSRNIITVNPTAGIGLVGTPYALPVEFHGGGGYTKSTDEVNITQTVTNVASATKISIQRQIENISKQIGEIQKSIDKLKARISNKSE